MTRGENGKAVENIHQIDRVQVGPIQSNEGDLAVKLILTFVGGDRIAGWLSTASAEHLVTALRESIDAIERGGPPQDWDTRH